MITKDELPFDWALLVAMYGGDHVDQLLEVARTSERKVAVCTNHPDRPGNAHYGDYSLCIECFKNRK